MPSASSSKSDAPVQSPSSERKGRKFGRDPDIRSVTVDGKALDAEDFTGVLEQLRSEQHDLKDQKKKLARELRNAQRRRQRLRAKAKELSSEDLVSVLLMRQQDQTRRQARQEASAGDLSASAADDNAKASPLPEAEVEGNVEDR